MILVIRISGLVEMLTSINETLFRMHLRKKYSAILLKDTEGNRNLLQLIRNFVAYGPVDRATLELLISKRGISLDKKRVDYKKAAEMAEEGNIDKAGIKPYFRLHPPRGGIKSKIHFPKGILGDNGAKINDLVRRML